MNQDGALCLIVGTAVLVGIAIGICYLVTMQTALSRVAPHNRMMAPGMVWLGLIPCVNLFWNFMIATRVPDSLRNEFRERRQDDGTDYGKGVGVTLAVLNLVSACMGPGLNQAGRQAGGAG